MGKAGGEKGSEAYRNTSMTFFADNAVPRALQPIAAERRFEMGSSTSDVNGLHRHEEIPKPEV